MDVGFVDDLAVRAENVRRQFMRLEEWFRLAADACEAGAREEAESLVA